MCLEVYYMHKGHLPVTDILDQAPFTTIKELISFRGQISIKLDLFGLKGLFLIYRFGLLLCPQFGDFVRKVVFSVYCIYVE